MKDKTAIQIALDAIIYKRRTYAAGYNAHKSGYRSPSTEGAYKQYKRLTKAMDWLEDMAEVLAEPEPDPQRRLDL
jgi:hypothetical protein